MDSINKDDNLILADEKSEPIATVEMPSMLAIKEDSQLPIVNPTATTWKVMIVDDELQIHEVTQLALQDFIFKDKPLTFISAYSAEEAKSLLKKHPDVALIFLDVVMEKPDAGLQLVKYIRETLQNQIVRIILRTGQAGEAPEEDVIVNYDINDYKLKVELTQCKLFATMVAGLRAYHDLMTIEVNKSALKQTLEVMPVGIAMLNLLGKPIYFNQKARQILGKGIIHKATAKNLAKIYQLYVAGSSQQYPSESLPMVRALRGESIRVDDIEIHQGEKIIPIEAWSTPIFDDKGKVSYAITAFQDITERLKREQAGRVREAIETVNRRTMESIQYAKIIQNALLPNREQIKTFLPKSFFIWMPRNIVGGDMLYTEPFEDNIIVAIIDCTGHGIPGAFMAMVASTALRRVTRDEGCLIPNDILKRLNVLVKTSLQQDADYIHSDNGLDAAICLIKPHEKTLTFAGANLPLYYIYQNQLHVIKGNKHSLGYKKSDVDFDFMAHTIKIKKGMSFYLSTDGFINQLGGSKRFSFSRKRFKLLLLENCHLSFDEQAKKLLQAFNHYKGDNDRQDDVTVVGFGF
ncbi:SpoIIE family protein phosphatase [Candidatus Parabeggiatoa sp. HSG14]|uniref:SpoIIE family protein phosphatase n=1 Tax=Candidatus Parabeggiatoa sp. HSG14 TaxID=3055593 RepID=UPI0025A8AFF1|nr:SpoIIE family protein phosphatase [Thiotrichales bacterium HSG14]